MQRSAWAAVNDHWRRRAAGRAGVCAHASAHDGALQANRGGGRGEWCSSSALKVGNHRLQRWGSKSTRGGAQRARRRHNVAAQRARRRRGPPTSRRGATGASGGSTNERKPGKEGGVWGEGHARSGAAGRCSASVHIVPLAAQAPPGRCSCSARLTRAEKASVPAQLPCWLRWAALHAALCAGQCCFWHSRLRGVSCGQAGRGAIIW